MSYFNRDFVAAKLGKMMENNALFIGKLQAPHMCEMVLKSCESEKGENGNLLTKG